jgi:hypothetical protein
MTTSGGSTAGIRAFEERDLEQVGRLWDAVFRPKTSLVSSDTTEFLRRTLLSDPLFDPDVPSLVYARRDGRVIAFLGSSVHRMKFDHRSVRAVTSAHFMIDPAANVQGAGALLLGRLLAGPQDLTTTDTATPATLPLWRRFGGRPQHLGGVGWIRIFQPSSVARRLLAERPGAAGWLRRAPVAPLWRLADVVLRRGIDLVSGSATAPASSPATASSEPLSGAEAAGELAAIGEGFRLRADYDASQLEALYDDLARFGRGIPVSRVVRQGGRTLGAYVYLLEPGGLCPVLAVACSEDDAKAVVDSLFEHASSHDAAALVGRVEAHLQEALTQSSALFFASAIRRLVHARDPEMLAAIDSGSALMTRLDGEWW